MGGGRHSAAALSAFLNAMFGSSIAYGLQVVPTGSTGLSVVVTAGTGQIDTGQGYSRIIQTDDVETLTVSAPSATYARKDIIVAYIDNTVTTTTTVVDNINDVLKFKVVAGTPSASPSDPSDATIQAAITAGNPFIKLGRLNVLANATGFTSGNIDDLRNMISPPFGTSMIADSAVTLAKLNGGTTAGVLTTNSSGVVRVSVWTNWTPTFTNVSGGTLNVARCVKVGKTVFFKLQYTLAGAGISGAITFTLPSTANESSNDYQKPLGTAMIVDAGTALYDAKTVFSDSTYTKATIRAVNASGTYSTLTNISSTVPFTWGSGDFFSVEGMYEEA